MWTTLNKVLNNSGLVWWLKFNFLSKHIPRCFQEDEQVTVASLKKTLG